jgi:hypothetical protein
MPIAESFFATLAGKVFSKVEEKWTEETEKERKNWDRLADHFDRIINCLEGMVEKLKSFEIPYESGNQLKQIINGFDRVAYSVYDKKDKKDKKAVEEIRNLLDQSQERARNIDQILRGALHPKVNPSIRLQRDELIRDIKRAIGQFRGIAANLRATEP